MRFFGSLALEEGKFRGYKVVIPAEALIEVEMYGSKHYRKACLIHEEFIPDQGCFKCKKEEEALGVQSPAMQEVPE